MSGYLERFVELMEEDTNLQQDDYRWLREGELLQLNFNFTEEQWKEEVLLPAMPEEEKRAEKFAKKFANTPVSVIARISTDTPAEIDYLVIETVLDVDIPLGKKSHYYRKNIYQVIADFNNLENLEGPKAEAFLTGKAVLYERDGHGDLYLESRVAAEPLLGENELSDNQILNVIFERAAWTSTVAVMWLLGKQGDLVHLPKTSFTNHAIFSGEKHG